MGHFAYVGKYYHIVNFLILYHVTDLGVHILLHEHAPMNVVRTILVDEPSAVWMSCGLSKIHRISVTTVNTKKKYMGLRNCSIYSVQ